MGWIDILGDFMGGGWICGVGWLILQDGSTGCGNGSLRVDGLAVHSWVGTGFLGQD